MTSIADRFLAILDRHRDRHVPAASVTILDPDLWRFAATVGDLRLRALGEDGVTRLTDFAARLGPQSRDLFCPYPWHDPAALTAAFASAVAQWRARIDASYLVIAGDATVAHGFLWKAGGNLHSRAHGVAVPELGVAVADAWQGSGLGSLLVRVLQAVATELGADGVELTTAMANDRGWSTYLAAGFVHLGTIRTPLGVDVTAATLGEVQATRHRDERQMVWIARPERRDAVLAYLTAKRAMA